MKNTIQVDHAMLLAAGLGTRMRPLTLTIPKPMVSIGGRSMLERALDAIENAGVETVVINVHHLSRQIVEHLENAPRNRLKTIISDESDLLLDSAGGVVKALPLLGKMPFFILNADTFWTDKNRSNLVRLQEYFNPDKMDILMLTITPNQAPAPEKGDFFMSPDGRLTRASSGHPDAVTYAGALIIKPEIFDGAEITPHSLNHYFDKAISENRLYGLPLEGYWYTVGTMDMIPVVEKLLSEHNKSAENRMI